MGASDNFTVVANELGQFSLWREGPGVPPGWRQRSAAMTEDECLAVIERSWRDMTPASTGAWGGAHGSAPVHELFAEQAGRRPDAPAVIVGRARLSYGDLEASANRLAHYLGETGAGPEAVVGVHLERGADVIRGILAIMKAGAGYLPLDPALPAERLAAICARVRPTAVITAGAGQFPVPGPRLVPLGELVGELARRPATVPAVRPAPGNVCYVIHTSGSTGDPRAVAVSYGNLACSIPEIAHEYQIGPGDRVAQLASLSFDTSIEQIFTALTRGATLILPPPGAMAPSEVLRGIERKHVTVIDLTPAYWHQVLALAEPADERMRSVRLMITGGAQADAGDCGAALQAAPWATLLRELARQAAHDPSRPMTAFLPLFADRDTASDLTVAEMYLGHIFPSYSRMNTERALRGTGIAFESADGQLLDRNIDRLMRTGYLPDPPGGRLADAG